MLFKIYNSKRDLFTLFKYSLFIVIPIIGAGIIKSQIDNNCWDEKIRRFEIAEKKKNQKETENKIDSLTKEISQDSKNAKANFDLGLIYRQHGEWEKSVTFYERAIKINPSISDYYSELAYSESSLEISEFEKAIRHYEKAIELDSTQTWIKSEINRCKRMKNRRVNSLP